MWILRKNRDNFKCRSPPFALKEKIERELNRLVHEGIVTPVEFYEWATRLYVYEVIIK